MNLIENPEIRHEIPVGSDSRNKILVLVDDLFTFALKHIGLSLIASIAGIGLAIYSTTQARIVDLYKDEVANLKSVVDLERSQSFQQQQEFEKLLHQLMPSELDAPVLLSPPNDARLVRPFVTLEWKDRNERPYSDYIVEVRHLDTFPGSLDDDFTFLATTPHSKSTRFPESGPGEIKPGTYFWRVVEGTITNGNRHYAGNWSGYRTFTIYENPVDRIKALGKLQVGVHYTHESAYMTRDRQGNPSGKDFELIKRIAAEFGLDSNFANGIKDGQKEFKVYTRHYPNVDTLLLSGVLKGEVDVAIGEITRTKSREQRGVVFTKSYLTSPLVLLSLPGTRKLRPGDKIGILKGTTYAKAATYLKKKLDFRAVEDTSLGGLLIRLDSNEIDFIILDKPVAEPWVKNRYEIAGELDSYLTDYYKDEYRDEYAIATADIQMCHKINSIMETAALKEYLKNTYPQNNLTHLKPCYIPNR